MSRNVQVKILEVNGLEIAARYVGLPVGKIRLRAEVRERETPPTTIWISWVLAQESLLRLNKLIAKGDEHAKIMRQVIAHMEITAPRYWWQQFATYRAGVEMYSGSTMHTLMRGVSGKDFVHGVQEDTLDMVDYFVNESPDLRYAKINLPEGYLQTRLVMVSYQTLRRMWLQRRGHRLPEWAEFIEALHELPYCENLIFVEPHNPWRELWVEWFDSHEGRGSEQCFLCCGDLDYHSPGCVYPKVKRLLDKEAR